MSIVNYALFYDDDEAPLLLAHCATPPRDLLARRRRATNLMLALAHIYCTKFGDKQSAGDATSLTVSTPVDKIDNHSVCCCKKTSLFTVIREDDIGNVYRGCRDPQTCNIADYQHKCPPLAYSVRRENVTQPYINTFMIMNENIKYATV